MSFINDATKSFKEEFYKTRSLKIDTTKCLGDEFPTLNVIKGITETGTSFSWDEEKKILVVCTILDEEEYFGDLIYANPEIFSVDNIDDAWNAIQSRIMLDYNLSVLR